MIKKNKKCWTLGFALLILLLLLVPNVFSLQSSNALIQSYGVISGGASKTPALHVEGRYIKNAQGDIVYLRGVGKLHWDDDPTGWWGNDHLVFNNSTVLSNLRAMKSWDMNVVRFHTTAEWWIQDNITNFQGYYSGSYRRNLKQAFQLAQQEGLYVIMDLFCIKNGYWLYYNGGTTTCLPFIPYLGTAEERAIFPNGKQSFIDYWASVANELKDYPNVIFDLYNEPHWQGFPDGTHRATSEADWFDAQQKAINAIRATGAKNLIIIEWLSSTVPYAFNSTVGMQWVYQYPLTDPANNLLYSAHFYRTWYNPDWYNGYDYNYAYAAMQNMKIDYVLHTLNKPVIVGEMGVDQGLTGIELQRELAWATNVLNICNQWGISYAAWVWSAKDQWRLYTSETTFSPTAWGQVLINAIRAGGTISPP